MHWLIPELCGCFWICSFGIWMVSLLDIYCGDVVQFINVPDTTWYNKRPISDNFRCCGTLHQLLPPFLDIQIKICAEYRDMLPRPRLVCQEPGLRPIGRSPGVPDKSSRGLGSMSQYSAQILICFIAYIFSIFNFSVGLVGNLAELPPCTVPPATVHRYHNEAAQCSSDNQISQHALLRGSRKKHSLAFMPQNWWN